MKVKIHVNEQCHESKTLYKAYLHIHMFEKNPLNPNTLGCAEISKTLKKTTFKSLLPLLVALSCPFTWSSALSADCCAPTSWMSTQFAVGVSATYWFLSSQRWF